MRTRWCVRRRALSVAARFAGMLIAGLLLAPAAVTGQAPTVIEGEPFTRFEPSGEIGCHTQVFAVAITPAGYVVIGHGAGLHWFNGDVWAPVEGTPTEPVAALTTLRDGRIAAGTLGDVGIIDGRPDGALTYRSVLAASERPPSGQKHRARQIVERSDGTLVVRYGDGLLLLEPTDDGYRPILLDAFPLHNESTWVRFVTRLGERVLFTTNEGGLHVLHGREARPVPGGKPLAPLPITGMVALPDERLLIATYKGKLFLWTPAELKPVNGPLGTFADKQTLTSLTRHDGYFTLGSTRGVVRFDEALRITELFLQSENGRVFHALGPPATDREGGVWFGAQNGVFRIEIDSAFRVVDRRHGLHGSIRAIHRVGGTLYAGTTRRLYKITRTSEVDARPTATALARIGAVYDLDSHAGYLLVAGETGLLAIDANGRAGVLIPRAVHAIAKSPKGRLFAAADRAFVEFGMREGEWRIVRRTKTKMPLVDALVAPNEKHVWFAAFSGEDYRVGRFDTSQATWAPTLDLPKTKPAPTSLVIWRKTLFAGTPHEMLARDDARETFGNTHPVSVRLRDNGHGATNCAVDAADALWFWRAPGHSGRARYADGAILVDEPLRRIGAANVLSFYGEANGIVWAGTADGRLVRYEETQRITDDLPGIVVEPVFRFPERVRRDADGTIHVDEEFSTIDLRWRLPRLAQPGTNRFQCRIIGLDETWQPWSRDGRREITGLTADHYAFELRARDVHGNRTTTRFALYASRAWYRTTLATVVFAILLTIGAAGFVAWRVSVAKKRIRVLAAEIRRREETEQRLNTEIDEHLKTASQRARLQDKLRETQRLEALGRMASGVAHDLNNILTAVIGEVDLATTKSQGVSPDLAGRLTRIDEAAERAASLTRQLLAFGRSQLLRPEVVDMNEAIRALEPMLTRLLRSDTPLALDLSPDAGSVRVDPGQFEQVVVNLAMNAADAMPDGGTITIATRTSYAHAGHAELCVADTGVGMSERVQEEMFDPFFTTKQARGGTGLGLSIVHGIIAQSGGKIAVDTKEGHGTKIIVVLPCCAPRAAVVERAPVKRRAVQDRTATILVCDDDPAIVRLVREILTIEGHRVLTADGPRRAARCAREHDAPIDLLITDIIMPGGTGLDLVDALRRDDEDLPVIYISGYAKQALNERIEEDERTAFLSKPFGAATLRDVVDRMLETATTEEWR